MSFYEERFRGHHIYNNIDSITDKLQLIIADANPEAIDHLNRLLSIVIYTKTILENLIPILIPINPIDKIDNLLTVIINLLVSYEGNKDLNQLVSANAQADLIVVNIQYLPGIQTPLDLKNLTNDLTKMNETIETIIMNINAKRIDLENKFSSIFDNTTKIDDNINKQNQIIENQKGRLDAAISQFQTQFSEAEDRRREQFENASTKRTELFENIQQQLTATINSFIGEKKNQVEKEITEFKKETNRNIDELNQNANNLYRSHEEAASNTVKYLIEKREEAKRLLDIIGNIGVTGDYNKIANQERKTANILRAISLTFMVTGIIVIGTLVLHISQPNFDWKLILFRIGVGAIMVLPALYAARESDRHRRREITNRKMELELASLGPFLELLPEDKRIELKANLTEKFFGQPEPVPISEKDEFASANSILTVLEKLVTAVIKSK